MTARLRTSMLVPVTILALLATACGAPAERETAGAARTGPTSAPLVEISPEAPTEIDVPTTVLAAEQVSAEGATIALEGAWLTIPGGAVSGPTDVEVLRLDAPFHLNPYADDEPDAVLVDPAGPILDFGPAGLSFDEPVQVTLPYDPQAATAPDAQPALAYWTGERWLLLEGFVDEQARTVSVLLPSFEGIALTTVLVLGAGAAAWGYIGVKVAASKDPITEGTAAEYVTPKDPAVVQAARGATVDGVDLSDEDALAALLQGEAGTKGVKVLIPDANGTPTGVKYTTASGANWQKPADYLSPNPTGTTFEGVPAIGNRQGDCTDATNAFTSMFRALGYPAQGVFGYTVDTESPHAWVEVAIGGKPYIVDQSGKIQELSAAMAAQQLIRPEAGDSRAFGWDETGQRAYTPEWWNQVDTSPDLAGEWTGTLTFASFDGTGTPGELTCNSSTGLPITVPATVTFIKVDPGYYVAQMRYESISCLVDYESSHSETVVSEWNTGDFEGKRPVEAGVELTLNGRTLTGADPQGNLFAGTAARDGRSITGTFDMPTAGATLSGTWQLTR